MGEVISLFFCAGSFFVSQRRYLISRRGKVEVVARVGRELWK